MPNTNRAAKHFEELHLTDYEAWYDDNTLKYLVHSLPEPHSYFRSRKWQIVLKKKRE